MEQLKLNMIPNGVNPVFHASQYDKGRQIRFVLDETLSGAAVTVSYRAKDGTEYGNVHMSVSGSTITDTIPEEVLTDYGIIEGEVDIDGIGSLNFFVEAEKDAYDGGVITTQTASGAIATFETNIETAFVSLKSDINPVQDLHGYSKPWSGGGGKNKINYNVWKTSSITNGTAVWENNGVKLTATANDCYTQAPNGFPSGAIIPISEGETITLSWEEPTNLDGSVYIFPNNTTTGMVRAYNQQVKKLSYTATSGVTYVTFRFGVSNSGDTIAYKNIQIEKGSTATAYEPYENICPISGFSEANIVSGKNLWNSDLCVQAYLDGNGQAVANAANITPNFGYYCKANQSITISANTTIYNIGYCVIRASDGVVTSSVNNNNVSTVTVTPTANSYIKVWISKDNASLGTLEQAKAWAKSAEIQIEFGTSRTTYGGEVITNISFGQTVYGGVADVTNGKVTLTHGIIDLGTLTWVLITMGGNRKGFRASLPLMKTVSSSAIAFNAICSNYATLSGNAVYSGSDGISAWGTNATDIGIYDSTKESMSVSDFKTAMSGVQLVYELATPIEISTTPEYLTAIVGQNNVYSDTNGDTEVEYYIEV